MPSIFGAFLGRVEREEEIVIRTMEYPWRSWFPLVPEHRPCLGAHCRGEGRSLRWDKLKADRALRRRRDPTRNVAKVAYWGDQVEVALGDFTSPETFAKAVTGVEGVFIMNGPLDGGIFRQLIDATRLRAAQESYFSRHSLQDRPSLRSASCTRTRRT